MKTWEAYKAGMSRDDFIELAAFDDCNICPARFFCTTDPKDPDYHEFCADTFKAWSEREDNK